MKTYPQIAALLFNEPWAIAPAKLAAIVAAFEARLEGATLGEEELRAVVGQDERPPPQPVKKVAVLPMFGTIVQHAGLVTNRSGGTSAQVLSDQIQQAADDPSIGAIVLHANTPGGSVYGVGELADTIFAARQRKPVIGAVNSVAASAGYWAISQASEIYITPGGEVGSIGVVTVHRDESKAEESSGVKTTIIATPPAKALGAGPMNEELATVVAKRHAVIYDRFTAAVARGRGVSQDRAKSEEFGGGGMVMAKDAVAAGMADGVATLRQVIDIALRKIGARPKAANENRLRLAEAS